MGHEIREPPGVARVGTRLGGTARREGWDCCVLVKREPVVHAACKLRVRCLRPGTARTLRYEFKAMLAELHASVIQDKRFKNLTLDELDRALLWGCLRYRAWSDPLTMAVVSAAGCFFGGYLALNVCSGGYATPMLEALCEFAPAARPPIPSTPNSRGLAIRPFCLAEPRVAAAAAAQTRGSSTSASSGAGSS